MGIDWKGLSGALEIPTADIKRHSLAHNQAEGYHPENFPSEESYKERWRDIMGIGSGLHQCWVGLEEYVEGCYIMAPLGKSEFIHIRSKWKKSGARDGTEMHSLVCENPQYLVREVVGEFGGIREPPAWSIGLKIPADVIEVSGPEGIGLSSWLFQLSTERNTTGVACGVPIDLLRELFPEVRTWILEYRDNRVHEFSSDALQCLVLGAGGTGSDGLGGGNSEIIERRLDDYYSIEVISNGFDIDLGTLIAIFLDDVNPNDSDFLWSESFGLESGEAVIARMVLYDRTKPLSMLIENPGLAKYWMENAKTRYAETDFPFTEHEMQEIISNQGPDACFQIFSSCLSMMSGYSSDSRLLMARFLTRVGGQKDIERVWSSVGPIGKQGIESIMDDVQIWRNNDGIRDFWGLIGTLEGSQSDFSFRRKFASRIVSASAKPGDLEGLVRFIPDIAASDKNYKIDSGIISSVSSSRTKALARINQIQPSRDKIQLRLKLFIRHGGAPKGHWKISDHIPESSLGLLEDSGWVHPLLQEVEKRHIYQDEYPYDGFVWKGKLTPSGYFSWMDDASMSGFIRKGNFEPKRSLGWIEPKAISKNLSPDMPDWETKQEWARLLIEPTISERMAYRMEVVSRLVAGLCLIGMAFCVLITPPLVVQLGGSYFYGVALSAASIAAGWVIEILRRKNHGSTTVGLLKQIIAIVLIFASLLLSFSSLQVMDLSFDNQIKVTDLELGTYRIPVLNSPFLGFLLLPVLLQINRIMNDKESRVSEAKQQTYELLGI